MTKDGIPSLDVEATGLDHRHGALPYLVTVCESQQDPIYWQWPVDPTTRIPQMLNEDVQAIRKWLIDHDWRICGQHLKFDVHMLVAAEIITEVEALLILDQCDDTLVLGHLLASNHPHDLTAMVLYYLRHDIQPLEDAVEVATKAALRQVRARAVKAVEFAQAVSRNSYLWPASEATISPYAKWRLAKEGAEDMPSVKGSGKNKDNRAWKNDMWIVRELGRSLVSQHLREDGPDGLDSGPAMAELLSEDFDPAWLSTCSDYACGDSTTTVALRDMMVQLVEQRGLTKHYKMRLEVLGASWKMERNGVTALVARTDQIEEQFGLTSAACHARCVELSGGRLEQLPVNGKSKALEDTVYNGFGLVSDKTTEKGNPSMDKYVIEDWLLQTDPSSEAHEFLLNLQYYRKRQTALGYIDSYRKYWMEPQRAGYKVHPAHEATYRSDVRVLFPSYNVTGTKLLRGSMNNPNGQQICFDGETELLTSMGWVRADQLTTGHVVAQYWKHTGEIDFTIPEVHHHHFTGQMQHITTDLFIDMMLTPEHRCLLRQRKVKKLVDVKATQFKSDHEHLHAGTYQGGPTEYTSDQVIWLCAVQADGSYVKTDGVEYGITFGLRKKRKIDRLRQCLLNMGVRFSESLQASGTTSIYVGKHEPAVAFAKSLMPDKCFGEWLLYCSRQTLDTICAEIFLWDGCSTTDNQYSSSIKKNADWIQIAWTLSGSRAWIASRIPTKEATNLQYYVNLTKGQDYSGTTNFHREGVDWDGPVYCVTVPSSYIVIRRNGKVSITGNSKQNMSEMGSLEKGKSVRWMFGPAPDREWWSMDGQNIELRIPAYEAEEEDLIYVFDHPDDGPYYGSYHLVICDLLWPEEFRQHPGKLFKERFEDTLYQWGKNGNFSKQYGGQCKKVDATFRRPGAFDLIGDRFPKMQALNDRLKMMADRTGCVETIPDKTVDPSRGYPLICTMSDRGGVVPTNPMSYHVQGTAGWWINKGMVRCHRQLMEWNRGGWDGKLIMQIHDELVFDLPRGTGREPWRTNLPRIRKLKALLEQGGDDLGVPTPCSVEYHQSTWAEGMAV